MPLINCQVPLILTLYENCFDWYYNTSSNRAQRGNLARPAINAPTSTTFQITDTKLYVPVVTLSTENEKKILGTIKNRI